MQEEQKCSSCFLTELQQLAGKGDSMATVSYTHLPQYLDKISFNAVIDEQNDFACSSNFFTYDFLKDAVVTACLLYTSRCV